jgi:SAM-dependent methyltransferase
MSNTEGNPYERRGPQTVWEAHEARRLQTMDQLLSAVTSADLQPVFASLPKDEPLCFLDIGAGTGATTEQLCSEASHIRYYALDVNDDFLRARPTPRTHMIQARSEALPINNGVFDITYSRAVTAWNKNPEVAIAEQLRATRLGGVAVFTEFDWTDSGVELDSDAIEACMGVRAITELVLTLGGFNVEYGAQLGTAVDRATERSDKKDIHYMRREVRHQFPAGDYRSIFLEAADNILAQLQERGRGMAETLSMMLQEYIPTIHDAEHCALRLPALVTETVTLEEA